MTRKSIVEAQQNATPPLRTAARHFNNESNKYGGVIMKIFGLGMPELLIILGVALLIFGPKQLPKLGSALGRTVKNLRDGFNSGNGMMKNASSDEAEEEAPKRKKKAAAKRIEAAKEVEADEAEEELATA